jgi:hypothetical protein
MAYTFAQETESNAMSFGVHPLILIAAIASVLAVAALVAVWRVRSVWQRVLFCLLFFLMACPGLFLVCAFNPWLVDARFRTYRHFYQDIEVGMTREAVLAQLEKHYPASGPRGTPKILEDTATRLGFFMNPEGNREPNCEGIFLSLADGRVTQKSYSAD